MIRLQQTTSTTELALAQQIRRQVFVEEQGIAAELEYDTADATAIHVLAYDGENAVATGRLVLDAAGLGTLGRIAVLPSARGNGIGGQVVRRLEACAQQAGAKRLILHPHFYLEKFYTDLGYHTLPDSESRVGPHRLIAMAKWLATD